MQLYIDKQTFKKQITKFLIMPNANNIMPILVDANNGKHPREGVSGWISPKWPNSRSMSMWGSLYNSTSEERCFILLMEAHL